MQAYERAVQLAAQLSAAGLRAVVNTKDVNPPCVLIEDATANFDVNRAWGTVEWWLWVLVPGEGTGESWQLMDRMVDSIRQLLPCESYRRAMLPATTGLTPTPAKYVIYREIVEG
jgi:hypothetical protein